MASMACKQKAGVSAHILPYRSLAARRCGKNSFVPSFSNICKGSYTRASFTAPMQVQGKTKLNKALEQDLEDRHTISNTKNIVSILKAVSTYNTCQELQQQHSRASNLTEGCLFLILCNLLAALCIIFWIRRSSSSSSSSSYEIDTIQ